MPTTQDEKISLLDSATALAGTETFPIVQSSETRKATIAQIKTYINPLVWIEYKVTFGTFTAAALTQDISLFSLGIKQYINDIKIVPTTAFSGGAIASYTLSVGIVGSLAKYCPAKNVFTGNTTTTEIHGCIAGLESVSAATDIRIAATTTGANLNAATLGAASVYVLVSTLP